jgi:putative tryptophan/tyrosine transport system substrate-binding protein
MLLSRHTRRREFITLLGGAVAWPLVGQAQQAGGVRRVGVLIAGSPPDPMTGLLRRHLRDLGYAEGQNIGFEVRYAMDQSERAAELARELVKLNVDIIVAHFTPAAIAAKEAKSRPHESGQHDKWSFCLTAGTLCSANQERA